jgi:hypothetical protein
VLEIEVVVEQGLEFFAGEVKKLGFDPAKTTTFEWLEEDHRISHA